MKINRRNVRERAVEGIFWSIGGGVATGVLLGPGAGVFVGIGTLVFSLVRLIEVEVQA